MRIFKKVIAGICILSLVFKMFTGFVDINSVVNAGKMAEKESDSTIEYSGVSGDLNWSIDSEGCLIITGSGDYNDSIYTVGPEWCDYAEYIKTAEVYVENITLANAMFRGCGNLESVYLGGSDMSQVTYTGDMFSQCYSLTTIDFGDWDMSGITDMGFMFNECSSLTTLDLSEWDISKVEDMRGMFLGCSSLISLDLSGWYILEGTDTENMFDQYATADIKGPMYQKDMYGVSGDLEWVIDSEGCLSITGSGDYEVVYNEKYGTEVPPWCEYGEFIKKAIVTVKDITTTEGMFYNCASLTELDVTDWNMDNAKELVAMFGFCRSLTSLDLSTWNTAPDIMKDFVIECEKLESIDISNFDMCEIEDEMDVFDGCTDLTSIKAPLNVNVEIALPGQYWYDAEENYYEKLPLNTTESIVLTKSEYAPCSASIDINGYQISTVVEGSRTVYSLSDPESQVMDVGLIYGMADCVDETEMVIGSSNGDVHSYEATEIGKLSKNYSDTEGAVSYAMTMTYGNIKTAEYFSEDFMVRAYAVLDDGRYIYSDI